MDIDARPLTPPPVDSVLLVGFGGPVGPDDVLPFLENAPRARGILPERLSALAGPYLAVFGAVGALHAPVRGGCRWLKVGKISGAGVRGILLAMVLPIGPLVPPVDDNIRQLIAP